MKFGKANIILPVQHSVNRKALTPAKKRPAAAAPVARKAPRARIMLMYPRRVHTASRHDG